MSDYCKECGKPWSYSPCDDCQAVIMNDDGTGENFSVPWGYDKEFGDD